MSACSTAAADWEGAAGGYGPLISVPALPPGMLGASALPWRPGSKADVIGAAQDVALSLAFCRDTGEGRVLLNWRGEPEVAYWPNAQDRASILKVCMTQGQPASRGGTGPG